MKAYHCLLTVFLVIAPPVANANANANPNGNASDGSHPRCEQARQRAKSKASLLFSPTLNAKGLRIPGGTSLEETGEAHYGSETQWQARAHLGISPTDIYKGSVVLRSAEAKCEQIIAKEALEDFLVQGTDYGQKNALRKQLTFLQSLGERASELVIEQERRFAEQLITIAELRAIRARHAQFKRLIMNLEEKLAYLETNDSSEPPGDFNVLLHTFKTTSRKYENVESRLRKIDPWRVEINGGAAWVGEPDWFATLGISFNFGAFAQNAAEKRYLAAVDDELHDSSRFLGGRARLLSLYLKESAARYERRLALVEEEQASLKIEQRQIESVESSRKDQILVLLEFDDFELEGESIYLKEIISMRKKI